MWGILANQNFLFNQNTIGFNIIVEHLSKINHFPLMPC